MKNNKLDKILNDLKKEINFDISFENKEFNESNDISLKKTEPEIKDKVFINNFTSSSKFNIIWAENKETLLFSLLCSIMTIIIGLLSDYEYIIIGGFFTFILFSVLVFITFFKYVMLASSKARIPDDVLKRIDIIERKLEILSRKDIKSPDSKINEIEDEIREMKMVLKTIVDTIKR